MSDASDLQAQSNQTRLEFLHSELAICFTFITLAETERKFGNPEDAKRPIADAEKGYAALQRFMTDPKHALHIGDEERREITEGMQEIRKKLDSLER